VVLPTTSRALNRYGTDRLLTASDAIVKKMRRESNSYPRPVNAFHNLQKLRCQIYQDRRPPLHAIARWRSSSALKRPSAKRWRAERGRDRQRLI
jgi:hypothetical protein